MSYYPLDQDIVWMRYSEEQKRELIELEQETKKEIEKRLLEGIDKEMTIASLVEE